MSFPRIDLLSDEALLDLYGRAKTRLLFMKLLKQPQPSRDVYEFLDKLNEEISDRRLDQGPAHARPG